MRTGVKWPRISLWKTGCKPNCFTYFPTYYTDLLKQTFPLISVTEVERQLEIEFPTKIKFDNTKKLEYCLTATEKYAYCLDYVHFTAFQS